MLNHSFRMKASQPLLCRAVSSIRPMTRTTWMSKRRSISIVPPPWRPASVLDKYGMQNLHYFLVLMFCRWVEREARPISLRQLTFFGRLLTDTRLLGSANYVRLELPTRLRDMQTLPYAALVNPHISHVYELYYSAFEKLRKVPEIKTLEDNDRFCDVVREQLRDHLSVIPRLAMGVLEISEAIPSDQCDKLVNSLLRSRISRRVIAEQHCALTKAYHSPDHLPPAAKLHPEHGDEFVGEIFLRCNAKEIVQDCADTISDLARQAYGSDVALPEVVIQGAEDIFFPYIPSHLEYIIGELLRNSFQATVERHGHKPPPIEVLICEAAQHVIIRVSDQGGGIDREGLPNLWSFSKGYGVDAFLQISKLGNKNETLSTRTSMDAL
ncbi:pyruvate dehydrogenase kinase [Aureobasidium pullulans]|uniref:Protein-serine/threonine kinase n=2 Tax=Aureobasidium pullulans TaxID=5580 RepID=A0A4S9HYH3_AURPU|nr:pyruvate dehydrogenase kinase [Aureobasidium pullulans]THX80146.1 pyruvate dehydrogenase kinase [Aureobasidium pullulans]THY55601.1 pyruvate dehydrogenase kinase [Aureobasidium pullulans]THZ11025.1 pyruvate dehydrogenase kinase [Aureobasidium pullulans]TIA14929.1 pyruvate dehydrogenase kinase [Aureobasidium pullulans]